MNNHRYRTSIILFIIGLLATAIGMQFDAVNQLFVDIAKAGYIGAFLAGILYGTAFTSSLATVILIQLSHDSSPVLAAIIGGLGCAVYDFAIFALLRHQESHGMFTRIKNAFNQGVHMPAWLANTLGLLIIASPLPDELSAGLMSLTKLKAWQFAFIAWLANIAGILVIVSIGR